MLTLAVLLQVAASAAIAKIGAAFCAAIAVLAASFGISKIGGIALESIARQPEAANDIRASMIVAAALIEGVTFFAIVVCFVVLFV